MKEEDYVKFEEQVKKDIITTFLGIDIGNISLWSMYQLGIEKGLDISIEGESYAQNENKIE